MAKRRTQTQKLTALVVEQRRQQFEAGGNDWAIIDAVDLCARAGMPAPRWLADAFCERYLTWFLFGAESLDKAFGVTRKGARVSDLARREWLKPRVALRVKQLHVDGTPIDRNMFDRIGEEFGISGSLINNIYYARDNQWRELLPALPPFENF
jgi:hypothetical protein